MMRYFKILLMVLALLMAACSTTKKESKVENNKMDNVASNEEIDESDFILEEEGDEDSLAEEEEDVMAESQQEEGDDEDELLADEEAFEEEEDELLAAEGDSRPSIGAVMQYTVKENDTLMFIAFKLFGDYSRWKDISRMNPGLRSGNLKEGSTIKYEADGRAFSWNPKGSPYLIQGGDTLGTISHDKYGTDRRWKDIYNNNRPMIKDPNLIFAGFTLYYIPDRDVASR
jgi:nucleoid-associated protein YgaU